MERSKAAPKSLRAIRHDSKKNKLSESLQGVQERGVSNSHKTSKDHKLTVETEGGPEKPDNVDDPWSQQEVKNVSRAWNLSVTEEQDLVILGTRLSDIIHWKNTPAQVVRFMEAHGKSL